MVVLSAALEHTSGGPMLRVQTQRGWAVLPLEEEATVLLEAGALIMRDRLADRANAGNVMAGYLVSKLNEYVDNLQPH